MEAHINSTKNLYSVEKLPKAATVWKSSNTPKGGHKRP